LYAAHYGDMLAALIASHTGLTRCYYLDVPFDETARRHATKPKAAEYGAREMRSWYRSRDLLPGGLETLIPASSALDETVTRVMTDTSLSALPDSALPPPGARFAAPPPPDTTRPPPDPALPPRHPTPHPTSRPECAFEHTTASSNALLYTPVSVYECAFELARRSLIRS
jgi:hypothetical protein